MQITLKNLEQLKTAIESLQPNHQVEILRILHKHGVKINSSKSGICVNLTPLSSEILEELQLKVDFIRVREQTLDDFEKKTEEYKTMSTSYIKEDKEKMNSLIFQSQLKFFQLAHLVKIIEWFLEC